MVTLKQIQKENVRLRKMQSKLREIEKNNQDRKKLLLENKQLARRIKFGKQLAVGRKVSRIAGAVGKSTGRGLAKTGKGAFRGLQRYANFLDEQEKKQRSVNRKLKSVKRKKRR